MNGSSNRFKYGTLFVMICAWLGTIFGWAWLWGILFLLWTIGIVRTGDATVVERVTREENPVWFWFIAVSWFLLSLTLFTPASWWGY